MQSFLRLSDEQTDQMMQIMNQAIEKLLTIKKETQLKIYEQLDEQREHLMKILTSKQRKQLETLLELAHQE